MLKKLLEKIATEIFKRNEIILFNLERSLGKNKNYIQPAPNSPERGWPDPGRTTEFVQMPWKVEDMPTFLPLIISIVKNCKKSLNSISKNPNNGQIKADKEFIDEFEKYAKSLGVGAIGYTKVPREYIFKERAILFENAIVFTMEMDKDKLEQAPSKETEEMVFKTYKSLSEVINKLTDYLREKGYASQAGYPLGGMVLYPALAQKAGLGWHGRHGLLITPEFGPRQRIGAIYTSIDNLPFSEENAHEWVGDFCKKCGKCIKACPAKAIYEEPVNHDNGLITHIERKKCFPYFNEKNACSVCIKECVFGRKSYEEIKKSFIITS